MSRPSLARRFGDWGRRNSISITITMLIALFILIYFSPLIFITIPAGHRGVMWWRFFGGTSTEWTFGEGMRIIPPWDKIYIYDTRLQQVTLGVDALTADGLSVNLDVAVRFRLVPENVGLLHQAVGPSFLDTLVIPNISNEIRNEVAGYNPDALYSRARETIEARIDRNAGLSMSEVADDEHPKKDFITLEDILIRGVRLPDQVADAIATKNVERHRMEQYQYILQRERMESERKQIEAQGIKAFQDVVSSGISANYLRWKGIDATLKLAESPNAKMVVIGKTDGLPLILGDWWNDATSGSMGIGQTLSAPDGRRPTSEENAAMPAPSAGTPRIPGSDGSPAASPPDGAGLPQPNGPGGVVDIPPVAGESFYRDMTGRPAEAGPAQPMDDAIFRADSTRRSREGHSPVVNRSGAQAVGNEAVDLGGGVGNGYDAALSPNDDPGGAPSQPPAGPIPVTPRP